MNPKMIQCPECSGEATSLKVMYSCAKDHTWGEIVDRPLSALGKQPLDAVAKEIAGEIGDQGNTEQG